MDEHTKQLGEAMATILDAIEANEVARQESPLRGITEKPRVYTMDDIMRDDPDRGDDYVRDPIGMSLRDGLRRLGKVMAQFKSVGEMQELAEHVATQKNFHWRIDVIDKNWDGIIDKDGGVWVA